MQVKEFMTSNVSCCTEETTLDKVAQMMASEDCGEIPVIEGANERQLVGVITDRDIVVRAVAKGSDPKTLTAADCMTEDPATVTPTTTLEECVELMERRQVRRVPVVDEHGACCGIVSQADIARKAPSQKTAEVVREISVN